MNILDKIINYKKAETLGLSCKYKNIIPAKSQKSFLKFLQNKKKTWPRIIAEIKVKSPSKGEIFPNADIIKIAKIYEKNGASAISCLTDNFFFGGKLEYLKKLSSIIKIPILRKDFIIKKSQIKEARIFGADAILLMTSVLKTSEKLQDFREYAESFDMDCLVETHDEKEIEIAINSGAKIIGINSRDFNDPNLKINLNNFQKLLPLIPDKIIKIAESGLEKLEELEKISHLCDGVLIGTNFMKTQDYKKMGKLVKKFSKK